MQRAVLCRLLEEAGSKVADVIGLFGELVGRHSVRVEAARGIAMDTAIAPSLRHMQMRPDFLMNNMNLIRKQRDYRCRACLPLGERCQEA
jgi:hypothetical protein